MSDNRQPIFQAVAIATGAAMVFHLSLLQSPQGLATMAAGSGMALGAAIWLAGRERPSTHGTEGYRRPWENKLAAAGTIALGLFGMWAAMIGAFIWFNRLKKSGATGGSGTGGGFARFEERVSALQKSALANGQPELAAKLHKFAQGDALQEIVQGPAPISRPATAPLSTPTKPPTRPLDAPRPKAATRPLPPEPVAPAPEPAPLDRWGLSSLSTTSDLDRWGLSTTVTPSATTTTSSSIADTYGQPAVSGFDEALAILQGKKPEDLHR